jgi:tryptophanyl-tRNA synthetase
MSALTDPSRIKKDDPGHPDVCMVYYYHKLFTGEDDCKNICSECKAGKRGCVACKKQLIENINNTLEPIRNKRHYYEERPKEVRDILMAGTAHAREISKETMLKVKKAMKLDF